MSTDPDIQSTDYGYGPLVVECRRRGISRSWAYVLQRRGLLDTFMLGNKRMVRIASLESLPERLEQAAANDR